MVGVTRFELVASSVSEYKTWSQEGSDKGMNWANAPPRVLVRTRDTTSKSTKKSTTFLGYEQRKGQRLKGVYTMGQNDKKHAESLRNVMDELNGVRETLDALANMKREDMHALEMLSRVVDEAYARLDEIAETLDEPHTLEN